MVLDTYEDALFESSLKELIDNEIKEYDKALREAIKNYLSVRGDPKTEYAVQWYPRNEILEAIEKAKVGEE